MLARHAPVFAAALLVTACSSAPGASIAGASTTSGGGGAAASSSSGKANAASSSSSSSPMSSGAATSGAGGFDAGAPLTTITTSMTVAAVPSGVENTVCIHVRLKNVEGAFVRRFRATLSPGSHHMIAYRSPATQEDVAPQPCVPFAGILFGEQPVFIAQQANAELVFPTDQGVPVGFEIDPNQMVKLELHYINTTAAAADITGHIFLDTVPLTTTVTKSDLAFWGTKNISIGPYAAFQTPVYFQPALPNTKTFALTTHEHSLGTRMRVWYTDGAANIGSNPVADGKNWHDPPLVILDPPVAFPDSGNGLWSSKGFAYQCEWKNTTPTFVSFGEGFHDEMCFLWHYYFPSKGFQFCIDGLCK